MDPATESWLEEVLLFRSLEAFPAFRSWDVAGREVTYRGDDLDALAEEAARLRREVSSPRGRDALARLQELAETAQELEAVLVMQPD